MLVKINDIEYTFEGKITVLAACNAVGIHIPTLCYDKKADNHGRCRICTVEINGTLQLACETYLEDAMEIYTNSSRVIRARECILKLLIKEHNFECHICKKSISCHFLQTVTSYNIESSNDMVIKQEKSNTKFLNALIYDKSKCISCGKCIKNISSSNVINPSLFMQNDIQVTKKCDPLKLVELCPTSALMVDE